MATQIVAPGVIGAAVPGSVTTTANFSIGARAFASDGSEWIYLRIPVSTTIRQYDACCISPTFSTQALTNTLAARGMAVVISQLSVTSDASNIQYAWFLVANPAASTDYKVRVAASAAIDIRLGSTAFVGTLDDTTGGSAIPVFGIVLTDSQPAGSSGSRTFRTAIHGMTFNTAV